MHSFHLSSVAVLPVHRTHKQRMKMYLGVPVHTCNFWCTCDPPAPERRRQEDCNKFDASLVYRSNCSPVRATKKSLSPKTRQNKISKQLNKQAKNSQCMEGQTKNVLHAYHSVLHCYVYLHRIKYISSFV